MWKRDGEKMSDMKFSRLIILTALIVALLGFSSAGLSMSGAGELDGICVFASGVVTADGSETEMDRAVESPVNIQGRISGSGESRSVGSICMEYGYFETAPMFAKKALRTDVNE